MQIGTAQYFYRKGQRYNSIPFGAAVYKAAALFISTFFDRFLQLFLRYVNECTLETKQVCTFFLFLEEKQEDCSPGCGSPPSDFDFANDRLRNRNWRSY